MNEKLAEITEFERQYEWTNNKENEMESKMNISKMLDVIQAAQEVMYS